MALKPPTRNRGCWKLLRNDFECIKSAGLQQMRLIKMWTGRGGAKDRTRLETFPCLPKLALNYDSQPPKPPPLLSRTRDRERERSQGSWLPNDGQTPRQTGKPLATCHFSPGKLRVRLKRFAQFAKIIIHFGEIQSGNTETFSCQT